MVLYSIIEGGNMNANTRATISPEEKTKSENFVSLINGVMEIVDSVADKIDDGNYLELCNKLRDLYKLKPDDSVARYLIAQLAEDDVVRDNMRRSRMAVRRTKETELMSDYDKLKSGGYKRCEDCSRVVSIGYFGRHKKNGVCIKTTSSKKISADTGKANTSKQEDLICKITSIKSKRNIRNNAGTSEAGSSTD